MFTKENISLYKHELQTAVEECEIVCLVVTYCRRVHGIVLSQIMCGYNNWKECAHFEWMDTKLKTNI